MVNNEPGFQSRKYDGPWVNATHPGAVATDQLEQAVDAYGTVGRIGVKGMKPFMKDPVDEGCRPALFAATSEDIMKEGIQGQYVSLVCLHQSCFSVPAELTEPPKIVPDRKVTNPSKQAQDEELGENLWRLSEQIIREKLGSVPYKQELSSQD